MNDVTAPAQHRFRLSRSWVRLIGIGLFLVLLVRFDGSRIGLSILQARPGYVLVALILIFPLIGLKTLRWQGLLKSQDIDVAFPSAFLAYFSSLFIGFLTPGRLGEFSKALYVSNDLGVSSGRAFSGVLVDRLFDLLALLIVGGFALGRLPLGGWQITALVIGAGLLAFSLAVIISGNLAPMKKRALQRLSWIGDKFPALWAWLADLRTGIRHLTLPWLGAGVLLTVTAYAVFFSQCYLLALALDLPAGFGSVTYAIALGSLVTLIPISVSGLGTREATIILYLGMFGVEPEAALSFSILVFAVFYIGGGLIGFLAWLVKPIPLHK